MKKLAVVLASLLILSGCGREGVAVSRTNDNLTEESITLSDGREVVCVVYKHGRAGGLSCDWEGGK